MACTHLVCHLGLTVQFVGLPVCRFVCLAWPAGWLAHLASPPPPPRLQVQSSVLKVDTKSQELPLLGHDHCIVVDGTRHCHGPPSCCSRPRHWPSRLKRGEKQRTLEWPCLECSGPSAQIKFPTGRVDGLTPNSHVGQFGRAEKQASTRTPGLGAKALPASHHWGASNVDELCEVTGLAITGASRHKRGSYTSSASSSSLFTAPSPTQAVPVIPYNPRPWTRTETIDTYLLLISLSSCTPLRRQPSS
jgi:hypothetical protein